MGKDSYWFRHDSTAGRGLRLRKIAHIYGHWGKGIYWDVIEILREQDNYCHLKDDSSLQMLCSLIGCTDTTKFVNWYKDCIKIDLLQEDASSFFSSVLRKNMGFWEKQKRNGGLSSGNKEPKHSQSIAKLKPTKSQSKAKVKPKHNIIGDNIIIKNKIKKEQLLFSSSPFFDKVEFAKALAGWSKDKLKYYYDSALTWSNEGNSKKDWIATVKTWAARDEKLGKLKFQPDKIETLTAPAIDADDFYDRRK